MVRNVILLASLMVVSLAYATPPNPESVEQLLADAKTERLLDAKAAK